MSFNLFNSAVAATTSSGAQGAQHQSSMMSFVLLWVGLLFILYFLMWRPQSKRVKEQKRMLSALGKGDEIVTSGGMVGKINKLNDDFIVLSISESTNIIIQKSAVAATLPKGTIGSI